MENMHEATEEGFNEYIKKRDVHEKIENDALKKLRAEQEDSYNKLSQGSPVGALGYPLMFPEKSPREYLHRFLLEAKQVGCTVDSYIEAEIKKMLVELER